MLARPTTPESMGHHGLSKHTCTSHQWHWWPKSPPRDSTTTTYRHTHTHTHTYALLTHCIALSHRTRPPSQPARASQATVVESRNVNPPRLDALEDRASPSYPNLHRHHATYLLTRLYPRPTSPNLVNCPRPRHSQTHPLGAVALGPGRLRTGGGKMFRPPLPRRRDLVGRRRLTPRMESEDRTSHHHQSCK